MPLNDRKIISIILDECRAVEQRCTGYRDEMLSLVSDIVELERQHRVQATSIQKKIGDKCNAAARFLASKRSQVGADED